MVKNGQGPGAGVNLSQRFGATPTAMGVTAGADNDLIHCGQEYSFHFTDTEAWTDYVTCLKMPRK